LSSGIAVSSVSLFFSSLIERDKIVLDFIGFFSDWDTSGAGRACSQSDLGLGVDEGWLGHALENNAEILVDLRRSHTFADNF